MQYDGKEIISLFRYLMKDQVANMERQSVIYGHNVARHISIMVSRAACDSALINLLMIFFNGIP